jgi:hypothetical protein
MSPKTQPQMPTFLWSHLFVVHKAFPWHIVGIKGQTAFDVFKCRRG